MLKSTIAPLRSIIVLLSAIGYSEVGAQLPVQQAAEQMPLWAYGFDTPPPPGATHLPQPNPTRGLRPGDDPDDVRIARQAQGSDAIFTRIEIRDGHNVADWFPQDHPPMTDIVRYGPASLTEDRGWACGYCHLPNGKGRPENAPPGGQPAAYIVQQLRDMRAGLRRSADPRKRNSPTMNALASAMTDEEIQEIAAYFASMPWTPWIEVIEAELIPEMELEVGNMYITVGNEPTEPLDGRIVETPVDAFQANYLRNPRSSWIAYVPVGSIARGEALVTTGSGKTIPCGTCHGPNLMGLATFPGIAGRSPSYMMRQLWDMKVGTRRGPLAITMTPVLANLTVAEMTDIVAYLASLSPPE